MDRKKFIKNILYAFSAQFISLILSFTMSLVVPKMLGVEEYSYWQLFLFYSSYVGFFAFGFNDGLYLKLGGCEYKKLDYSSIGTQIKINIFLQCVILSGVIIVMNYFVKDSLRFSVIIATAIYAILNNLNAYVGYILQAVNQTKKFSISTMLEKGSFLIIVVILMVFDLKSFQPFVLFYIIAKIIALTYSIYNGRAIIFSKIAPLNESIKEMINNMAIGMNLMLANIASMLILGFGRSIIDQVWGITAFGRFSLALSLCNFFLTFITQVSMVLFPALRRLDAKQIERFYRLSRSILSVALPAIFLVYIPMRKILSIWLPNYKESLIILGFLLPMCTYDGKMNLLCNTYFKVLRKEKVLLYVNLFAMALSAALAMVGAYIAKSVYFIVFGIVFSIALRSILSELILARYMNSSVIINVILESIVVLLYLVEIIFLNDTMAILTYLMVYAVFLLINRNSIREVFNIMIKKNNIGCN